MAHTVYSATSFIRAYTVLIKFKVSRRLAMRKRSCTVSIVRLTSGDPSINEQRVPPLLNGLDVRTEEGQAKVIGISWVLCICFWCITFFAGDAFCMHM
jgi:hypothetical protein